MMANMNERIFEELLVFLLQHGNTSSFSYFSAFGKQLSNLFICRILVPFPITQLEYYL